MSERLWSDDLIIAEIEDLSLDENSNNYLESNEKVRRLMRRMRNEYEAALDGARSWCKTAEENADLRKRLADLEAQLTRDYVKAVFDDEDLDMVSRRIDKLADRVAQLEREQRESEGEL